MKAKATLLLGFFLLAFWAVSGTFAKAQYIATDLDNGSNGGGSIGSTALGVSGNTEVGKTTESGQSVAILWNGTKASGTFVESPNYSFNEALGISGTNIVGDSTLIVPIPVFSIAVNASLWTSANRANYTVTNLAPTFAGVTAYLSIATAVSGNQQVGYAESTSSSSYNAVLWSGTAASAVNLNPAGYTASQAFATSGIQQAGCATTTGGIHHAMLWSGTAASAVDLHPAAYLSSTIYGISGSVEVGGANASGVTYPIMWSGTAASAKNIDTFSPVIVASGLALGVSGNEVVGYGTSILSGTQVAVLWNISAKTCVNLSSYLPGNASNAEACAVDSTTGNIVGYATVGGTTHAFLWTPTVAPTFTSPPQALTTIVGLKYSYTVGASGNPAVSYSLGSGNFPPGINLASSTGVISGTPTKTGTYTGTITASNGTSPNATQNFSITVVPSPSFQVSVVGSCLPADGDGSFGSLVQGIDGNFYGTADSNGPHSDGTVFEMTSSGSESVIRAFGDGTISNDGVAPVGLAQAPDGTFFGTTQMGGVNSQGTIFEISQGVTTIVHRFQDGTVARDGADPYETLVRGKDGNFYGVTLGGGATAPGGTVFSVTPQGVYSIVHRFGDGSVPNDGAFPYSPLIQAADGNFYGTTNWGGLAAGGGTKSGTVYKMTPQGVVTILHDFADGSVANDGQNPQGPLTQGTDGNFYGTTSKGGSAGQGTIFKMTPQGTVTILHSFGDGTVGNDGANNLTNNAPLIQGPDGNFYSVALFGGSGGEGCLYQITPTGSMLVLHSFGDGSVSNDGLLPNESWIMASDGNFYGLTTHGGIQLEGTLFKLSIQSAPVISSSPPPSTATVGTPYNFTYSTLGSLAPTLSVTDGALPDGLTLSTAGIISGTPTTAGTFTGTVTATNSSGTATQDFSITVYPTFDSWTAQEGLTGDNAQLTAIISPDGLTNQFKYALGLDPYTAYSPGDPALPLVKTTNVSGSTYLTLTFNGVATDMTYTVQATNDPSLPSASWTQLYSYKGAPAPGTVTVQDTQAESPDEPKRFLRLMISP